MLLIKKGNMYDVCHDSRFAVLLRIKLHMQTIQAFILVLMLAACCFSAGWAAKAREDIETNHKKVKIMTFADWENLKVKHGVSAWRHVDFIPLKTNAGHVFNNEAVEAHFRLYKKPPKLK